jgi:uncharacterized membrane protein (UPF0127 family)
VYIDKSHRVVKLVPSMKVFRASSALKESHAVIELPAGTIERSGTAVGDQLAIVE